MLIEIALCIILGWLVWKFLASKSVKPDEQKNAPDFMESDEFVLDDKQIQLIREATSGYPEAQFHLGLEYARGIATKAGYIKQGRSEALKYWELSANQKYLPAILHMGVATTKWKHKVGNAQEPNYWWRQAADMGHAGAQYILGDYSLAKAVTLESDQRKKKQPDDNGCNESEEYFAQAISFLTLSAKQDYGLAQRELIGIYRHWKHKFCDTDKLHSLIRYCLSKNNAPPISVFDIEKAFLDKELNAQAKNEYIMWFGNLDAPSCLAAMYTEGKYLPKDYSVAKVWWDKVVENSWIDYEHTPWLDLEGECHIFAWLCHLAVEKNQVAIEMLESIPELNETTRLKNAARKNKEPNRHTLDESLDDTPNPIEMLTQKLRSKLISKANRGERNAATTLGLIFAFSYFPDNEKKEVIKEAVFWLTKAASKQCPTAQLYLAYHYERGRGVEKCRKTALHWFNLAAQNKSSEAQYIAAKSVYELIELQRETEDFQNTFSQELAHAKNAAEAGHTRCSYLYHHMLKAVDKSKITNSRGNQYLRYAAENGHAQAQYEYGCHFADKAMLATTDDADDYYCIANYWFTKAATNRLNPNEGYAVSESMIALFDAYFYGKGVEADGAEAAIWLEMSRQRKDLEREP